MCSFLDDVEEKNRLYNHSDCWAIQFEHKNTHNYNVMPSLNFCFLFTWISTNLVDRQKFIWWPEVSTARSTLIKCTHKTRNSLICFDHSRSSSNYCLFPHSLFSLSVSRILPAPLYICTTQLSVTRRLSRTMMMVTLCATLTSVITYMR